jgi:hypothetical protein
MAIIGEVIATRARIEVEYKNHRHFEASSNIAFPTIKP